jgi:hypothetical protein
MTNEIDRDETATERGSRVTRLLVDCAPRFGLSAVTEYAFPGSRVDVVWQWRPPLPIPGVEAELPIVGFEVESSWRSRKHLKGDLVNLQDVRPLLGVIVLLGDGPEVESTRRFASQLVDRPGTRIVVWSEEDVHALIAGEASDLELDDLVGSPRSPEETAALAAQVEHTGKYRRLWEWLQRQQHSPVATTFTEIEQVIGMPLPPSCRRHLPHWYGYRGSAVGRAIRDAGWRARHVDLTAETVIFERLPHDMSAQSED